jgi:hypothetical protein
MSNLLPYTGNENNFWSFYTESNRLTEKITDWRTSKYVEYSLQMLLGRKIIEDGRSIKSTGSFPGVKSGRGVTLAPHPLLVSWSWKCRAIPLLPLWAVQPVENISACTRGPLYDVVIGHRVVLSILVTHHFHCGLWQPVLRTCRYWEFFLLSLHTFVFILIAASVIYM